MREGSATWRAMVPVDELFDVVIDSSEVGMRKPNPAIYHLALERLGGVPTRRGRVPRRLPRQRRSEHSGPGSTPSSWTTPTSALAELDALLTG